MSKSNVLRCSPVRVNKGFRLLVPTQSIAQGIVGSNPPLSATFDFTLYLQRFITESRKREWRNCM